MMVHRLNTRVFVEVDFTTHFRRLPIIRQGGRFVLKQFRNIHKTSKQRIDHLKCWMKDSLGSLGISNSQRSHIAKYISQDSRYSKVVYILSNCLLYLA
jgi:hypothetical protein